MKHYEGCVRWMYRVSQKHGKQRRREHTLTPPEDHRLIGQKEGGINH